MIDLEEVRWNLTDERIVDLMAGLGATEYRDTNDAIIFKTICHNHSEDEASMKLYYYKKNKLFHCYTDCGCSFDIFGLFRRRYKLLGIEYNFFKDIVLKIAEGLDIDETNSFYKPYKSDFDNYCAGAAQISIPTLNPQILNIFTFNPTPEWLNDGISIEAMKEYNILYSIRENKIIIPHYNSKGELIGIRGRALNPEDIELGKYMPVQIEDKIMSHPLGYNTYGLYNVKNNIKKFKMAIVAESEKACGQYYTMFGKENNICVAVCGSTLHLYQVQQLITAGADKILIAFDKEGENWEEQHKYFNKMKMFCERFEKYCQMGFIWDSQNLLKLKESPFDRGKATFLKLYKTAVWN